STRPILLNGIEDVISRPDLGDRALFLTLPPIGDAQRRPEGELWRLFELVRPHILGALLDAVAHGLRALGHVRLEALPRMADFALWATACETALWPAGIFACAYAANRRAAIESIMEADSIATCVRSIMADQTTWTGSATSRPCWRQRISISRADDADDADAKGRVRGHRMRLRWRSVLRLTALPGGMIRDRGAKDSDSLDLALLERASFPSCANDSDI